MSKSRLNILIVEDDATQGKALEEAFKRSGFSVTLCDTSARALTQVQRLEFHALIIDCMLPKMNGIDLVEEILNLVPYRPHVFMITGIYKDRKFIQDATRRTGATHFFIKPLHLEEVIAHVEGALADKMEPENPPILSLYDAEPPTATELAQLIEREPTLHAFHLPKLYQRLQQARATGELTLISAVGDLSSVEFFEGKVFAVKTPDKESFFGGLAISKGFVVPEDVLEALKDPTQKKLGEKLIESMSLSPHAIDIILEEQLALRLSQTIQDDVVSLQWTEHKFPKPPHTLLPERFQMLQEDWLSSKVTPDWIHSTLMVWGSFELGGEYHIHLRGGHSIEELLKHSSFDSARDLPTLFRALIQGDAYIGVRRGSASQDFSLLESRLDRMLVDMKQQNYFQILGIGEKAHQREISRAFEILKEAFDPARLPSHCPATVVSKCQRVFQEIEKIYAILSDDMERQRYMTLLQNRRSQETLEAEPIFRAAIVELENGHAKEAAEKLQTLIDRKLDFRDIRAYRLWAGLKCDRNYNAIRLDQIPPEERHSAAYMMAKGVHYRRNHQFRKALEAFRTAQILDPRLSIAKYELKKLAQHLERSGSQHREVLREATAVMETLFGRTGTTRRTRRGA
jgi:CheY-like chemotaxis protein